MFKPWKPQYQNFQRKFKSLYEEGNAWLVETDMAAFYETVDHEMLFKTLIDNDFLDEETKYHLETYLPVWASAKRGVLCKAYFRGALQGEIYYICRFSRDAR